MKRSWPVAALVLVPVLTGCGVAPDASPASPTPAAAVSTTSPPASPSPVSTAASLTGTCVMGWEWEPFDGSDSANGIFSPGTPPPASSQGDLVLAYRVTLSNGSESTAGVGGFAVVFYDASGTEDGSDSEQASGFIVPGQSLSWAVIEDHTVSGYGDDPNQQLAQTAAIPAGAASCQFLQWSSS